MFILIKVYKPFRQYSPSFCIKLVLICALLCSVKISDGSTQTLEDYLDQLAPFSPSLSVSASYAPISFEAWGTIQNAQILFISANYRHHQIKSGSFQADLSSGVIFTGWLRYPSDGISGPKENRYGLGFYPLDISIPFSSGKNYPFFTTSFGLMIMNRSFPNELGATLNYLLGAGLGYRVNLNKSNSLEFGYKLHHLSNGNTSIENPGIDSHMFFLNFFFHL